MFGRGGVVFNKVKPCENRRTEYLLADVPIWDDYYEGEPFRSSRLMLGVLGGMPFTWKKPHMPSRHPVQSTFVIAIITVFVLGLFEYNIVVSCYHSILYDNLSLRNIIVLIELILFSAFYFVYFTLWMDVPATKNAISCWVHMRSLYYGMTGQQKSQRRRFLENIINAAALVFSPVSLKFAIVTNPRVNTPLACYPVYIFAGSACLAFGTMWLAYFGSLQKMAKNINGLIKKDLSNGSLTLRKLQEYRKFWLQMRHLSKCLSSLWSPVLIYVILTVLTIMISYEIIILFENGENESGIVHINLWICCTYFIHFMANASHNAVQEIREFYNSILPCEKMYLMTPNKHREVLGLFLVNRAGSPAPSYGGFIVLNRAQALSVFAAISSYLVILMQFGQSFGKLESQSNTLSNTTNI